MTETCYAQHSEAARAVLYEMLATPHEAENINFAAFILTELHSIMRGRSTTHACSSINSHRHAGSPLLRRDVTALSMAAARAVEVSGVGMERISGRYFPQKPP